MDNNFKPSQDVLDSWHNDPANWKLGIFYFNKEDKRLFIPKRFFFGWTFNIANPFSIIIISGMAGLIVAAFFYEDHW